jgi:hypothetical protein
LHRDHAKHQANAVGHLHIQEDGRKKVEAISAPKDSLEATENPVPLTGQHSPEPSVVDPNGRRQLEANRDDARWQPHQLQTTQIAKALCCSVQPNHQRTSEA